MLLVCTAIIFSCHVPPSAAAMVDVDAATVTAHPVNPGARTRVTITFTITRTLEINDSITFEVSNTLGVPRTIDSSHIYISGMGTTTRTGPDNTGPFARLSAPSQSVIVLANRSEHRHRIVVDISDMSVGSGKQDGLSAGKVIVSFIQDAGITNRTEGGKDEWFVYTTAEPDLAAIPQENVYEVPFTVDLSENHVHRGEKITATGRGIERRTTVTFWRDSDNDGRLDSGEAVLCSAIATSKDIGKCAFTVAAPPFQGGVGSPGGVNYVNAVDGHGHSASVHVPLIHLEPFIDISPDTGGIGDPVHVHLADLDPGDRVSSIQLAGRWLCDDAYDGNYDGTPDLPCGRFIHEDQRHDHAGDMGALNFTLFIPGRSLDGNAVSIGFQELQVFIASQARDIHDKELDAILHLTPGEIITPSAIVLSNQRITVSGSGFTPSSGRKGVPPPSSDPPTGISPTVARMMGQPPPVTPTGAGSTSDM